jgi:hypothetical protein
MAAINTYYVAKGRGRKVRALEQQGRYTRNEVNKSLAELKADGLQENYLEDMDQSLATLGERYTKQQTTRGKARGETRVEVGSRTRGKSFKRRLWNAVGLLLKPGDPSKLTPSDFASGKIGDSTPRLIEYFERVKGHVQALDDRLKPFFKGGSAYAQLLEVEAALKAADDSQMSTSASAPIETQALWEAKGKVLDLIEQANRVARIAFDGDAARLSRFNKDLLLRASRVSSDEEDEEDSEETAESETPSPSTTDTSETTE